MVRQFNDMVAKACEDHNLFRDIRRLANKYQFTADDHAELEQLDKALTKILVKADKKYAKYRNSPWSVELHQAFLHHCYWTTKLIQARTKRNHSDTLKSIAAKLPEPPDERGSLTLNLRKAQRNIREIKRAAASKRESYLQDLTEAASNANDATKRKLILHLRIAEQNRKCFAIHRQFMKPRSAGGITKLLVPSPTTPQGWNTVVDPRAIESHLIQYCQNHFKTPQGTPYTIPPLAPLLNYDSLTPFGQQITQGTAKLDELPISHHTKLLLQHQSTWIPATYPRFHTLPFEALLDGFRKWPERTSTSPSGRHLGIYKSLAKDANHKQSKRNKNNTATATMAAPKNTPPEHNGAHVLQLIHQLLLMAVQHCHTFERWTTIWNFFIEKEIGNPNINKLRALHLIEADYNLLLKWFGPKGFIKRAEDNHQLTDSQGGGRRGRCAIDLACKKVATYDYLTIM